ncbi:MAG: cupin domain-containing protein [Desulfobulbaceae bacterium]
MKPTRTTPGDVSPYVTRDGSLIYELMHPSRHGVSRLSFARALVEPGQKTILHRHRRTEEIYHVIRGTGVMTLGEEVFSIGAGDTICIGPGRLHRVENTGDEPLEFFCCCAPPYSHEDTEIQPERG